MKYFLGRRTRDRRDVLVLTELNDTVERRRVHAAINDELTEQREDVRREQVESELEGWRDIGLLARSVKRRVLVDGANVETATGDVALDKPDADGARWLP